MNFVIVSGLSGSGKSIAIQSFEDLGFYCVDNLPTTLIPTFANLIVQSKTDRVALGIDVRERDFFDGVFQVLDELQQAGHRVEILFLEAREDVLVRRYSETRRRHPLAIDGSVSKGICLEQQRLEKLRQHATCILDTSDFTVHDLRDVMQATYSAQDAKGGMHILVLSFGFKFGVPSNTDLVFDVRFLPNPHFDPELWAYTGRDPRVAHYIFEAPVSQKFLEHLRQFLTMLIPLYAKEGKSYLTISLGCTGGKHRSVATAEEVGQHLRQLGYRVACHHRDLTKHA
ncbi:Nucleotide-binding protein YvcJ [Candidatus Entotheonellaceae bacterium PAL068K]